VELRDRTRQAYRMLRPCRVCPWNCGIDRRADSAGRCRSGWEPVVASANLHRGEEPPLSGRRGAGSDGIGRGQCLEAESFQRFGPSAALVCQVMTIRTGRRPDEMHEAGQVGRGGILDQALDRREAGVASDEQQIVAAVLLQHEFTEWPEHADQVAGLEGVREQPAGEGVVVIATDVEQQITIVAGTGGDRIIALEIGGGARHRKRH
jgi:hypothetical protein